MKRGEFNNMIVVSDLHCGCRMGLHSNQPTKLDDGGFYHPSTFQKKVFSWWQEFWDDFVPRTTKNEPFVLVVNGDALDGGAHHGNSTHISDNREDELKIAKAILEPVVEMSEQYYHIRGTEAHAGKSGVDEERLARELGAIPDETGQYARWELWYRLGFGLVNIMHHIGTAGSMHYETTAIQKELTEAYIESARWNEEPPDVVVRSHRHRNAETRVQTYKGFGTSFTTPGWQGKTPLVYRVAGARQARPQFGGSMIRCGDEDIFTRHFVKRLSRTRTAS